MLPHRALIEQYEPVHDINSMCLGKTHYYNSNLIWHAISCRVDEIIQTGSIEGYLMVLSHPRNVILYDRSRNYYNMFIIYIFSDIIPIL